MTTIDNSIPLKTANIVCIVENFDHAIQQASWNATCSNLDINIE